MLDNEIHSVYIILIFISIFLFKILYSRYMLKSFRPRFSFHRQVYRLFCRQTFSRSWRRSVSEDKTGVNTLCISEGLSKVVPGEVVEVPRTDREEGGILVGMVICHYSMWKCEKPGFTIIPQCLSIGVSCGVAIYVNSTINLERIRLLI